MYNPIMKNFEYEHFPASVQYLFKSISSAAHKMDFALPDGSEKEEGLKKLLEAKDCFLRAALED